MIKHFILTDDKQLAQADLMAWARWFEKADRRVALDQTKFFEVSTVFLGLDHNWSDRGPPILFETMVFDREVRIEEVFGRLWPIQKSVDMMRYSSWDDAVTGHKACVSRLRRQEKKALAAVEERKT